MILLVGASASGKTEIAKCICAKYGIVKAITHTTRPMRVNEVQDVDYHFVSKEVFEQMIKEDKLVEHTLYNGNYYGSSKAEIGDEKIVVVDPNGLKAYSELNDSNIVTFLLFASEKTRFDRMISRGDKYEDACKRIEHDKKGFADGQILATNFVIDSESDTIENLADKIYQTYLKAINE